MNALPLRFQPIPIHIDKTKFISPKGSFINETVE